MPRQDVRPSVRPPVCLSHASIVPKRLYISSKIFHRRVAPRYSSFSVPNGMVIFRRAPLTGFISGLRQDRAIVTMEGE